MNKAAKMMLLSRSRHDDKSHDWDRRYDIKTYNGGNYDGSRGGQGRDGRGTMGYNYPIRDNYDRDMPDYDNRNMWYDPFRHGGIRYDERPEIKDAFYDRRGRRHYDNGRYAPKAMYGDSYPPYMPERYDSDGDYRKTRMGFNRGYEFEMDGMAGDMKGYAKGKIMPSKMSHDRMNEEPKELDERTAKKWVAHMENEDGTIGAHWTIEQTDKVMEQLGFDCDSIEFWAAMNATYSDLCKVFKELGIDKLEAYAKYAKAFWLCDEDAVEDKLSAYYQYVVEH